MDFGGTGQGIRHLKLEESVNIGPDLCRKAMILVGLANALTMTTTAVVAAVVVAVAGSGSSICVAYHVHARIVCMHAIVRYLSFIQGIPCPLWRQSPSPAASAAPLRHVPDIGCRLKKGCSSKLPVPLCSSQQEGSFVLFAESVGSVLRFRKFRQGLKTQDSSKFRTWRSYRVNLLA